MKKRVYACFLAMSAMLTLQAQQVKVDNFHQLDLHYTTPDVKAVSSVLGGNEFTALSAEGYQNGGTVGSPALPVQTSLLTVPFCSDIEVVVSNAVYDTLPMEGTPLPLQPARQKSDTSPFRLVKDEAIYATDAYVGLPLASVNVEGVARDRRLALLTFAPVSINPAKGMMVVCRSADVSVRFVDADVDRTVEHYRRYHTPAFSVGTSINDPFVKTDINAAPVRMTIIAGSTLRCNALSRFADWKRRQGMLVDLLYTTDINATSRSAIEAYLQGLYDNATAESPAPVYVLLVGDVPQLPVKTGSLSVSYYGYTQTVEYPTDLYYTTWDGDDYLPEAYKGRFSATDTATVAAIVNKTLMYEQYAFPDDSYLAKAALVAGEDGGYSGDNAYLYADPAMDYIARYYVKSSNGFNDVTYYKNNTAFAPSGVTVTGSCSSSSASSALRNLYTNGVGWVNYSAHGSETSWGTPSFTVSNVSSMNNYNKPSVMIGNCCLSGKYDESVCLGEALLRRSNNAGAVAYIGASRETYWEHDFDWQVGVRTNFSNTMNTAYNSSNLGVYDRLFHTFSMSVTYHAVTTGAMLVAGNESVSRMSTSDGYKKYYWEIYHLFGDPSLMPWLGQASDLTNFSITADGTVHTVSYAYVAIIDTTTMELYSAAYAPGTGNVTIDVPADPSKYCVSVMAQGYKPYFRSFQTILGVDDVDEIPYTVSTMGHRVSVSGVDGRRVSLFTVDGRCLYNGCGETSVDVPQSGVYLLSVEGAATRKVVVL